MATDLKRELSRTLTATLAERDARIAELEAERPENQFQGKFEPDSEEPPRAKKRADKDDRRRFVDECAMRLFVAYQVDEKMRSHSDEMTAKWSYEGAEALAAERDRREQA